MTKHKKYYVLICFNDYPCSVPQGSDGTRECKRIAEDPRKAFGEYIMEYRMNHKSLKENMDLNILKIEKDIGWHSIEENGYSLFWNPKLAEVIFCQWP